MRLFSIPIFLFVMLAACATIPSHPEPATEATTEPQSATDQCRPTVARTAVAWLSGLRSVMTLAAERKACEEDYRATQEAAELCGRAAEEHMDECGEACARVNRDNKVPADAVAREAWVKAALKECSATVPVCQEIKPCTELGLKPNQSADEYDVLACLSSVADIDRVCGSALAAMSSTQEHGQANVEEARARAALARARAALAVAAQIRQPQNVMCTTTGPFTNCHSW